VNPLIARHWRGWTKVQDADAYENLLKQIVFPSLSNIEGYKGGYLLRNNGPQEVEFVVINLFDSLDAVKRFAGPDYGTRFSNRRQRDFCAESSLLQCITRSAPGQSDDDLSAIALPISPGLRMIDTTPDSIR
jgi:hypothetical protein